MTGKLLISSRRIAIVLLVIAAGAARGGDREILAAPGGSGDSPAARDSWAFRPPRDPPIPAVRFLSWPRSPIDRFILSKLEEKGLRPAPPADRRTLIRRATFDLLGLPPAPEEVERFEADPAPDAFDRLVDRLLGSPRYGERWGRHWLDIARYADTKGYAYDREERRFVHSHAYRDWVIRAFNEDLPYDRFLLEQLAADQLPRDRGGGPGELAAMGFLTVGRRFVNNIHDIIDDRIDTLMRGTQALTVSCARCHDHKFDPIPTRDYYSLYGVFAGSTEKTVCLVSSPEETPAYLAYLKELRARQEKLERTFQAKREELCERLRSRAPDYLAAVLDPERFPSEEFYAILEPDDLNPAVVRQWQAYLFQTAKGFHPVFAPWHELARLPAREFASRAARLVETLPGKGRINPLVARALAEAPPGSMSEVAARYGKLLLEARSRWLESVKTAAPGAAPPAALADRDEEELRQVLYGPDSPAGVPPGALAEVEWLFDEPARVELAKLQAEIDRWNLSSPGAPPQAVILADRAVQRNPRVFLRGNPRIRGEEVARGFLTALSGGKREPFKVGSGRLELAQAISSRENPLTARVMVNRIWLHHFGEGLVRTPSDFGARSDPPSHPELLDHLALRFMEDGWSMKKMHRRLLLSAAYRQDSSGDPACREACIRADPENRLLWRMNRQRLDFESLRDSLLQVSGELDLTMGGPPVDLLGQPPAPRRSVYGFIDRQNLPGVFRVFDFANPDQHCPRRHLTTVPQQALYLMNSPFVVERARALARRREIQEAAEPRERVRRLYRAVYQRGPSPGQLETALSFLASPRPEPEPAAPPAPSPWRYGFGEYEPASARLKGFQPLPHFTGEAWQGGPRWPDPKIGWVQLTAEGGHAGNDLEHAAVRRWVAPADLTVAITGAVAHAPEEGDGIRARIVSSRGGLLWKAELHHQTAEASVGELSVKAGDTIDFLVDYRANLNSDMFTWAPVIREIKAAGPAAADPGRVWSARKEFAGPPGERPPPLSAWEEYAQALLLSNEFVFID